MTERKFRGNTLGTIAKDACVIINLEDPSSWPIDLVIYLERHLDLFVGWENGAQGKGTSVSPQKFDRAICGLCDVLKSHSLIGWHCTRLTDDEIEAITAYGMRPPDAQMLGARIDALAKAGVIAADIAEKLCAKNQANETNRAGLSRGLVTGKRAALLSLSPLCGRVCIILLIAAGFHEWNIAPNLNSLEEVPRDCGSRRYSIP
jgi:hypothetical protein